MINIFCLLVGNKHTIQEVEALYSSVKENITGEFRFICLTDRPALFKSEGITFEQSPITTPNKWCKLALFVPKIAQKYEGTALYMDLDSKVVGNLDNLLKNKNDKLNLLDNFKSNVLIWKLGKFTKLYSRFKISDMKRLSGLSDLIKEQMQDVETKVINRLLVKKAELKINPLTAIHYDV